MSQPMRARDTKPTTVAPTEIPIFAASLRPGDATCEALEDVWVVVGSLVFVAVVLPLDDVLPPVSAVEDEVEVGVV